ncbi:MAG: hypothetical protein J6D11_07860 [Clostridia bacterium]|nr:hypothetical protein [Clostridia bacterium]
MKKEAKKQLIKDIVTAVIAWLVFGAVCCLLMEEFSFAGMILGLFFAGLPFGWRWMSKVLTATSILMVIIKGFISLFLGWIAIFVVIIGDIIVFVTAEE